MVLYGALGNTALNFKKEKNICFCGASLLVGN